MSHPAMFERFRNVTEQTDDEGASTLLNFKRIKIKRPAFLSLSTGGRKGGRVSEDQRKENHCRHVCQRILIRRKGSSCRMAITSRLFDNLSLSKYSIYFSIKNEMQTENFHSHLGGEQS